MEDRSEPVPGTDGAAAPTKRSGRGFSSMDPARQREIAALGGRTAHESGNAHQFTSEEARLAGRAGGVAVSRNRDYMVALGRRGGVARSEARQAQARGQAKNA